MNLLNWLRDQFHELTKPTEAELEAKLEAEYKRGRLDERYALLAQLATETQAAKAIDQALNQPGRKHGDVLHAWNRVNKPDYRPITLTPAPSVPHIDFPWLPDGSKLNARLPQTGAYDIPSLETEHRLAALHELLDGYAETEVKLKAVKAGHERK